MSEIKKVSVLVIIADIVVKCKKRENIRLSQMAFEIVLINPPPASEVDKHWARTPLLGISYIASSAISQGFQINFLDGKLAGLAMDEIVQRAIESSAGLIGITCMTVEYPLVKEIAARIKAKVSTPIVVGGAHVNAVGHSVLDDCSDIDFSCKGEGEFLLSELATALDKGSRMDNIDGLGYRESGGVLNNGTRGYPEDYDILPFPAWWMFVSTEQLPILTHRGCPFKCVFCGHNSGFMARYRSSENVLDEIGQMIERYQPKVIRFEDETFGLSTKRTMTLLNGIVDKGYHKKVRFSAQTRVDRINREIVIALKKANFETLELGVESGNDLVLLATKKGITLPQVRRAVKLAKEAGLTVWCKFILGHPNETLATIKDTVNFISELNPDRLSVAIMTPYPGTPIYDMAVKGEGGYRLLASDWGEFDKYSSGALELESVSISQLKYYQILCYLRLYTRNFRLGELIILAFSHKVMAGKMVASLFSSLLRRKSPV